MPSEVLRENIKFLLSYNDMSIRDLSKFQIISHGYASDFINEKRNNLSFKIIEKLSTYFNISVTDLTNISLNRDNIEQYLIKVTEKELKKHKSEIQFIEQKNGQVTEIPLYESTVSAGIPKEIFDYPPMKIAVAPIKQGAFAVKVSGDSMIDFKIDDGDTLVVFPTKELKFNHLVVAKCNDAYTVKKLEKRDEVYLLVPGNKKYEPFVINDIQHFEIIGYVLYIMKKPFLS